MLRSYLSSKLERKREIKKKDFLKNEVVKQNNPENKVKERGGERKIEGGEGRRKRKRRIKRREGGRTKDQKMK